MKTKFAVKSILGAAVSLGLFLVAQKSLSQTNLQFTAASSTDERNIQLTWASVSNEVYQIQEADILNSNGITTWNLLYDEYPSQGTNTFWLDTGNYNLVPQIPNPKNMPMRFYRIVDEGPDPLASDEPIVSIVSPATNSAATGELTITVVAATDQPVIGGTKLYVDGQEMFSADSRTNYTIGSTNYEEDTYSINTCEWLNRTHILFATAETESGYANTVNSGPVMTGHGVSTFVPVLFSNLITGISFSQPSFDPSSGQTQQVTAVFAANCDWTLQIENIENSNVVLTATGSGTSMTYNWDGTGTGETNIPVGIYLYNISAETNGESDEVESGGSSLSDSSELWAVAPDSEGAVPLALYPPGFDTNGFTIVSASPSEMSALRPSISRSFSTGGFSPADSPSSSAASQTAPAAPQRSPSFPTEFNAGTFGIEYDTYTSGGTNPISFFPIQNEPGITGSYISLNNYAGSARLPYGPLKQHTTEANDFISEMQQFGWICKFNNSDSQFGYNSLIGSGTPFNQVDIGLMMTHGAYGTSADFQASNCKQMYFPITQGSMYVRMSQMSLGGSGTNGLKWFAIAACNSLYQPNWNSMQSKFQRPYNNNLHLLLGFESEGYTSYSLMELWAKYMNLGTGGYANFKPLTVQNAWYQAGTDAYFGQNFTNSSIIFAFAGDSACVNDFIQRGFNSSPGGTWTYGSQTVWTHK